jgi:23S rRNA (pseudouridine1915-N3)-methyltransferase
MQKYVIRAVGRPNEPWHPQAIHSYLEKIRPFAQVQLIELEEGHEKSAKPNEAKTRAQEAVSLLKGLPNDAFVVALDETGTNLPSRAFADRVADWGYSGRPVAFLIGGSWGLDPSVRARADFLLSFGKHTMPHLLARIVLLEQLYRAATIHAGKIYHK